MVFRVLTPAIKPFVRPLNRVRIPFIHSLKLTANAPENGGPLESRKFLLETHHFSGAMNVSFREGNWFWGSCIHPCVFDGSAEAQVPQLLGWPRNRFLKKKWRLGRVSHGNQDEVSKHSRYATYMYHIWLRFMVNVGTYTIHWVSGLGMKRKLSYHWKLKMICVLWYQ